jgi:hypothetical protein
MGIGYPGSESDSIFASLAVFFRFLAFIADASEATLGQGAVR